MNKSNTTTNNNSNSTNNNIIGQERFKSDKRQLGGLLMLHGMTALVFPMANLATLVGPDGTTASEGIPLSSLVGSVFTILMGVMGVTLGYLQTVHDFGHKYLTGFCILFIQLAYVPFITDLTAVGRDARSGDAFFPPNYDHNEGDVRFVGAMGMMGVLGYGTALLGSLAFIAFALYSFQSGQPQARPGSYYRGRLHFYSFTILLAGLSQLLLGSFLLDRFGSGPLENSPVAVAMYFINFPEIAIAVGLVQVLNAIFGFARGFGLWNSKDNHMFQATLFVQWLMVITLQIMVQVAYAPAGMAAPRAPSATMLTLGLNFLPAYLDFKMRSTPESVPADYYGLDQTDPSKDDRNDSMDEEQEQV